MEDIFKVYKINYNDKTDTITSVSPTPPYDIKRLPVFNNRIFKSLSKTKPYCTSLFAYAEVYWSHIIKKFFSDATPLYNLAVCDGIEGIDIRKYKEGVLVDSYLKSNQTAMTLSEYFYKYPDDNFSSYVNYCEEMYDYRPVFETSLFKSNRYLSEQLAFKVLVSILTRDQNFHYDNNSLIFENNEIIGLNPVIDNEFSTIFFKLDKSIAHNISMGLYDLEMDTSIIPPYESLTASELNSKDIIDLLPLESFRKYKELFSKIFSDTLLAQTDNRTVGVYMYMFYKDCLCNSTQKKNIAYIVEHFPNVCNSFIKSLEEMIKSLKYIDSIDDEFISYTDSFAFYKWQKYFSSIGEYLKKYRNENNMSYEELSDLLGVQPAYIKDLEENPIHTSISLSFFNRICKLLNLNIEEPKFNNTSLDSIDDIFKNIVDETIRSAKMLHSTLLFYLNKVESDKKESPKKFNLE